MALGDVIARLSVHLGLETAAFEKNVGKAKREVTGMERHISKAGGLITKAFVGMFGAFAVGQLASMAKESLDFAASLGEVAKQLGVTTAELSEFRYVATQTGVSQDEMDKGLAKLSRTIGLAAGGNKAAVATFDKLGISVRDAGGNVRSTGAIFLEVADRYQKMGSAAEQSALSAEVFGSKLGQRLNPALAEGSLGLQKLREDANRMGLVMDDALIAKADQASDDIATLTNVISTKFSVAVAENADVIGGLVDKLIELITKIGSVREEFRKLELTMRQFDILTEPIGTSSWASRMARITEIQREKDIYNGEAYNRGARATKKSAELQRLAPAYGGTGIKQATPFRLAPPVGWPTNRASGSSPFGGKDWSRFTQGQGDGFMRTAEAVQGLLAPLQSVEAITARINVAVGAEMVRAFQGATQGAVNMASAAQSIMDRLFPEDARRRQYIEDLAKLRAEYGGTAAMADRLAEAERRLRAEWIMSLPAVDSLRVGLNNYMQAAEQAAVKAEQSNLRIGNSYASLAANVGGIIGQLIGGKTGRIIGGIFSLIGQAAPLFGGARADGGPVTGGRPYLVGERGPELVVPRSSGHVIPNHALGGSGRNVVEIVDTTGLFVTRVNGQIMRASPAIMDGSAKVTTSRLGRQSTRRLA